uniref:Uncharacterized protein n=1 Tax=Anguilla anguilla TaxID=7936 RepID=A0A0E9RTQ1_ANGAN
MLSISLFHEGIYFISYFFYFSCDDHTGPDFSFFGVHYFETPPPEGLVLYLD